MWTIFVLPLLNTILTGIFDYLIGTYRDEKHVESLIRPRFMAVFAFKVVVALFVFGSWLFSTDKGFIDRYSNPDYVGEIINGTLTTTLVPEDSGSNGKWHDGYCVCQVWTVFIACFLALCITELIITTNIVKCNKQPYHKLHQKTKHKKKKMQIDYSRYFVVFFCFFVLFCFWCKQTKKTKTKKLHLPLQTASIDKHDRIKMRKKDCAILSLVLFEFCQKPVLCAKVMLVYLQ